MKTRLKLFCAATAILFLSAAICTGQDVKKVGILECIDLQDDYTYGSRLLLQSKLAAAVNKTDGFEAYDRIDVSSIAGELNFQQSGAVSDDQIKRLGEMVGVDYVLISEIAKVSDETMFVMAKIVNVETAKIEKTADITCSSKVSSFEDACVALTRKLLEDLIETKTGELLGATPIEGKLVLYCPVHDDLLKEWKYVDMKGNRGILSGLDLSQVTVEIDGELIGISTLKDGFHYKLDISGQHELKVTVKNTFISVTKLKINTDKASYYEFMPSLNSVLGQYKLIVKHKM